MIVQNAPVYLKLLSYSLKWNTQLLSLHYNHAFSKISFKILLAYKDDPSILSKWQQQLQRLKQQIDQRFDLFLPRFEGEIIIVTTIDSPYIKQFQQEIAKLKPIKIKISEPGTEQPESPSNNLVDDIKDEVKKGNRVAFKLMNELQEKIDILSESSFEKEKQAIQLALQEHEEKAEGFIQLAIKALDSLELIATSANKAGYNEWSDEIGKIISDFLKVLVAHGIEEIPTLGEYINGETMISVGTVPKEEAPNLEKFQVCEVWQRGFRLKETGKLIREAKVKTVY